MFSGSNSVNFIHYRDGQEIPETLKVKINTKDDTSVLKITGVTRKQSGKYKCVAKNSAGKADHVSTITITGRARINGGPLQISFFIIIIILYHSSSFHILFLILLAFVHHAQYFVFHRTFIRFGCFIYFIHIFIFSSRHSITCKTHDFTPHALLLFTNHALYRFTILIWLRLQVQDRIIHIPRISIRLLDSSK